MEPIRPDEDELRAEPPIGAAEARTAEPGQRVCQEFGAFSPTH